MFNLLVLLGVAGSQFFRLPKIASGEELWVFFWLVLLSISSFFIAENRKVDSKALGFVLLAALSSVLLNITNVKATIFLLVFLNLFLGCLSVKVIAERFTISQRNFGKFLLRFWILNHFILILCKCGVIWKGYELSGYYTMPWIMGCAACLSIPFLKKLKAWHSLILFLPIVLSKSCVCIAVALVMWIQPKMSRKSILWCVFFILLGVFLFDPSIETTRFYVIQSSLKYWGNIYIGDGIGSWAHKALILYNGNDPYYWRWAHNESFQFLVETGIVGLLTLLYFIYYHFKVINREQRYAFFGVFALSMFHPIFHSPRLIPFLIVLFGYFTRRNSLEDKSSG